VIPFSARARESFQDTLQQWIARARSVGYDGFIIDISNMDQPASITKMLRDAAGSLDGFKIYTRKTITVQESQGMKDEFANIRGKTGVNFICIRSTNPEVLTFAAKDSRIDIIRLETLPEIQAFSEGIASLASQEGICIELPFAPLYKTHGAARSKFIREANKILEITMHKHASLIFSSDASRLTDIKNDWQKTVVINMLLGASKQVARDIFLKHPVELIDRYSRENTNETSNGIKRAGEDE
jgi:RNase P/RNase MRP subunit p30